MYKIIEIAFVVVYSVCFGSFLNVLIYRLPNHLSLFYPGSHCPKCGTMLKWYDNIPILSFLFLRGKCRYCGEKINIRYFLVELLTVGLILVAYFMHGMNHTFILGAFCMMVYLCIIFIDYKHYIIPDSLNLMLFIISVLAFFINIAEFLDFKIFHELFNVYSRINGIIMGFIICVVCEIIIKTTKKKIIGCGDLKLILASSLFLGFECLLLGIFIGSLIAVIVEIPLSNNKKYRSGHVLPFGPYLSYGFIISFLFGTNIINFYLNLIGG